MTRTLIAVTFVLFSLSALADDQNGELTFHGSDLPVVDALGNTQKCHRSEMGYLVGAEKEFQTALVEYSCTYASHDLMVMCSTYWSPGKRDVASRLGKAEFSGTTRIVTIVGNDTPMKAGETKYQDVAYGDLDKVATTFLHDVCLAQVHN